MLVELNALVLFKWKALAPEGVPPSERRSHSAAWWDKRKTLVIFGGGNGERALNDLYFLEFTVSGCHWRAVTTTGALPPPRGYHSSVIFKDKLFVYGGSDGRHSFSDLNILYLGGWMKDIFMQLYANRLLGMDHCRFVCARTCFFLLWSLCGRFGRFIIGKGFR